MGSREGEEEKEEGRVYIFAYTLNKISSDQTSVFHRLHRRVRRNELARPASTVNVHVEQIKWAVPNG